MTDGISRAERLQQRTKKERGGALPFRERAIAVLLLDVQLRHLDDEIRKLDEAMPAFPTPKYLSYHEELREARNRVLYWRSETSELGVRPKTWWDYIVIAIATWALEPRGS